MEPTDRPVQQELPFDVDDVPETPPQDEDELAAYLEQVAADEGIGPDEDDEEEG